MRALSVAAARPTGGRAQQQNPQQAGGSVRALSVAAARPIEAETSFRRSLSAAAVVASETGESGPGASTLAAAAVRKTVTVVERIVSHSPSSSFHVLRREDG